MRKSFNSLALLALTGAAMMSSCSKDTDLYDSNLALKEYEQNWTEMFGQVASDQDWNLATRCTANVDLSGVNGAATIKVMTGSPLDPDAALLAKYPASESSFKFDAVKGTSMLYVAIEDEDGNLLSGNYYSVSNNTLTIAPSTRGGMTRAEGAAPTSIKDVYYCTYATRDANNGYKDITLKATFCELENVTTAHNQSMSYADILAIVGEDGKFSEGTCNRDLYASVLNKDVVYDTNGEGIDITFNFGATQYSTKLAYYYWKDGEDPNEAVRYILVDDARPQSNITYSGDYYKDVYTWNSTTNQNDVTQEIGGTWDKEEFTDGMFLANGYLSDYYSHTVLNGTTYSLVFFDSNGNASYTFPKGYKVAFDMITTGSTTWPTTEDYLKDSYYSVSSHNAYIQKYYDGNTDAWKGGGEVSAVTYKAGGMVILGIEDGTDKDMNDFLFVVKGVDETDISEVISNDDPTPESWIIACEDLGDDDDYDFNDVVVKVSYVAGENTLSVTPLAAGGILKSVISFPSLNWSGEIHELLDSSLAGTADGSYPMLNTTGSGTVDTSNLDYKASAIDLGTTSDGFTLSNSQGADNMGGFTITVSDENGAKTIKAPTTGSIPQMFVVPGTWAWPTERTSIKTAYPKFANWTTDTTAWDWFE